MYDEKAFRRYVLTNLYLQEQKEYDEYWVENVWGFGPNMRNYLLNGPRRILTGR